MNGEQLLELNKYITDHNADKVLIICTTIIICALLLTLIVYLWRKMNKDKELKMIEKKLSYEDKKRQKEHDITKEIKELDHEHYFSKKKFDNNLENIHSREEDLIKVIDSMEKTLAGIHDVNRAKSSDHDTQDERNYEILNKDIKNLRQILKGISYEKL